MKKKQTIFLLLIFMFLFTGFQISNISDLNLNLRLWYLPFTIASVLILYKRLIKSKYINTIIIYLSISTVISFSVSGFALVQFTNSFLQISAMSIFFLLIYSITNFLNAKMIIKAYLTSSVIFAISVIFHEILYFFNADATLRLFGSADVSGIFLKATGLLGEPSWGGVLLAPSIYITLVQKQKTKSFVLLLGSIFTLSTLTYISLLLSIALYFSFLGKRNFLLKIAGGIVIILVGYTLANQEIISDRLEQTKIGLQIITDNNSTINQYNMASGTVSTLIFNTKVAYESILSTYGLGVGFGNFKYIYKDKFASIIPSDYSGEGLFYSRIGGGSLWIRITAELGFIGLIFLFVIHMKLYSYYGEMLTSRKTNVINTDQLILYALGIIIFTVYCIRKDAWINHVFLFSLSSILISSNYTKMAKNV